MCLWIPIEWIGRPLMENLRVGLPLAGLMEVARGVTGLVYGFG